MKKIFISLFAVAALAACTKSEVQYDAPNEISISPVASTLTKSVAGYGTGTNANVYDGIFPTDIDLYVFANAVEGTTSSEYFKNAQFKWNSSKGSEGNQTIEGATDAEDKTVATAGAYAGEPTRYWPNVKKLVFAGYSDACGVNKTTPTMNFTNNTLTIPSYTQNNATYSAEGKNDLMWFAWDGTEYSKQSDEIQANMQHACSWITIKVAADANMVASSCKLNALQLDKFYHTATAVCGATGATWNTFSNETTEDYLNNATQTLTTTATAYENTANNFIVIPQEPVNLNVTYTYVSDSANNLTSTEIKPVSLAYTTTEPTAWQSGVHYIYTITITATEILIDPVVVDWDETEKDLGNI